jgi:uncharacterized phage protein gp47/JayE
MALTQRELSLQMLAQLRMLDPSVSAEVGTPERKILDTVAQALTDVQIDLTQLGGALDIDAKSGAQLDRFLALFGFGRQNGVFASGVVTFSRTSPSNVDIRIPARTQVMAPNVSSALNDISNAVYETTFDVTLLAGQTSVSTPIAATISGAVGNVATGAISQFVSTPIFGIQDITNLVPTTGGVDAESDEELKIRFKNTVFRNLAGTQDQYLALAASTKYTTKANVVGPISRYREYIQVPPVDDATAYNVNPQSGNAEYGNGIEGQWTSALSTIPYSKYTYTSVPNFVSNGQVGPSQIFWREDIDWNINTTPGSRNRGDAFRFANSDLTPQIGIDPVSPEAQFRPNITFLNIYDGDNEDVAAVRPGEVVLFEHAYMSSASRNDWVRRVTNCVDIFIDGGNDTLASTVIPAPGSSLLSAFVNRDGSRYHYNNYRLWGEPDIAPGTWASASPPAPGGSFVPNTYLFLPLFWQPVTGLPNIIIVRQAEDEAFFILGTHYWLVYDNTELFGTVRARNGICWNRNLAGATSALGTGTGLALKDFTDPNLSISIDSYIYDRNVVDLQASVEASKQVTTDVLVHRARTRYFKFDITVMYTGGVNVQSTNAQIQDAVNRYLRSLYFGTVIQLSDLLQAIHNVAGVDNVRWSSDIPGNSDLERVYETNIGGVDRGPDFTYASDFFLMDDELPALPQALSTDDLDAVIARRYQALPGVIIRTRAQNSFTRA